MRWLSNFDLDCSLAKSLANVARRDCKSPLLRCASSNSSRTLAMMMGCDGFGDRMLSSPGFKYVCGTDSVSEVLSRIAALSANFVSVNLSSDGVCSI